MVPFALIGAGAYSMEIPGNPNPYGIVASVNAGVGVQFPLGPIRAFIELQSRLILSDYGNSDFETSTYLPLSAGVRF